MPTSTSGKPPTPFLSTLSLRRATVHAASRPRRRGFLSTLSLRRATSAARTAAKWTLNFYPRSPCGERLPRRGREKFSARISIHALLAESDGFSSGAKADSVTFLSTLSLRRATTKKKINPASQTFLSTLSLRRATPEYFFVWHCMRISIHALLAESDAIYPSSTPPKEYFYPRSPCGERPVHFDTLSALASISIHALLAESDGRVNLLRFKAIISIHALLAESDPSLYQLYDTYAISIHALLAESDSHLSM